MKSYVTMEQQVCIVCGKQFDTGAILMDRRLRETFDTYTVTGRGLCPEDDKLFKEGYVALVAIDPEKSHVGNRSTLQQEEVFRTGRLAHVRREACNRIFNVSVGNGPMIFVEDEVIDKLQAMMPKEETHEQEE